MNVKVQKKSFNAPKLHVYGKIANLTQAFGNVSVADFVFIGSSNVQHGFPSVGSQDGIIVPRIP